MIIPPALLVLALLAAPWAGAGGSGAPALHLVSSQPLPSDLKPRDLRVLNGDTVLLADAGGQVVTVVGDSHGWREKHREGNVWVGWHLAEQDGAMALGSPIREVGVKAGDGTWGSFAAFEGVEDLDLHDGQLAVLGLQLTETPEGTGEAAPDGAIAWVVDLGAVRTQAPTGGGPPSQRVTAQADKSVAAPVLFSVAGPGAAPMNNCVTGRLGALRYLENGSLVIAPGVEPGVSMFDPGRQLVQRWDTGTLGISDFCGSMAPEDVEKFTAEEAYRAEVINRQVVIEDIVEWHGRPGLLLRAMAGEHPAWALIALGSGGDSPSVQLPIEPGSRYSRVKADVHANRLFILRYEPHGVDGGSAAAILEVAERDG